MESQGFADRAYDGNLSNKDPAWSRTEATLITAGDESKQTVCNAAQMTASSFQSSHKSRHVQQLLIRMSSINRPKESNTVISRLLVLVSRVSL
ncbi:hypothetical protein H4Q26_008867 [Puccinia striiformis f. sp. tritici PST-130]|nr:hypothetical protein H4Q26_008867 [Puccinia striiformis f. sp. tritici PST-130]